MSIGYAIAKIFDFDLKIVGTGFLVDDSHLVTSAQLVSSVLELPSGSAPTQDDILLLDFPFSSLFSFSSCTVSSWNPEDDIAILELEDTPKGTWQAPLVELFGPYSEEYSVWGFPPDAKYGYWAPIMIVGTAANGWLIVQNKYKTNPAGEGYCGCPIWDIRVNGVIGMLSIAGGKLDLSFVVPSQKIKRVLSQLPKNITGGAPNSDLLARSLKSDRAALRVKMLQVFDNTDIRNMCFDLGIDFESLSGDNKSDKIRELIAFCERVELVGELIILCKQQRAGVSW